MKGPPWRIVIADDNPDDRREIRRLLLTGSESRYEFMECECAAEALRLVMESPTQKPDCLLLDFYMPDMDAPELLPALLAADGLTACPVLVITGRADPSHGREVLRLGAQDFIGKEWLSAPALSRAVENAIERWMMGRELRAGRRALEVRERELSTLADNTPDLLTRLDRVHRIVFVNAAVTRATGLPVEEILGRTIRELRIPEQLCDRWEAAVARVLQYGTTEDMEFTYEGPAGLAHYASRLVPEFEADGRIYQVLGVTRDITQLRRQESSARESAERLQLALAAAQAGAWSWDIRSGAIEWSAENYVLYGQSPSLGPPLHGDWFSTVHPDDRANVDRAMRDTLSRKVAEFRAEFRVLWADGDMRWILGIGKAEFDEAGEAVRMIGINLDIHDRKRIEKALQDEDRRKDEFLATLSHELRNPLAPLTTGLEVLRLAPAGAAVAVSALGVMERQLTHLVRLVDDLMDVSRIRSGKIEMKVEVVSIGDVVRQAVEACQPLIEKALQRLDVVVEPTHITVTGDEMRLTQVLTNVLSNAAKYTANGGHILLQAGIEDGQVLLRVVDDGVGIAPAMLSEVFELFAQVDTSRHRAGGGLGIGLSLVRKLVTLHGGTVLCDSRGLGLGTTVEIRLPLLMSGEADVIVNADPAPQVVTVINEDIVPGDAVRRVLLIDDNVDGAETMASMLRLNGYQVWTAYDGDAGLTAAMAVRPASIVVDIGLPIIDGYGVARRVRLEPSLRNVRLIALTGWGSARDQGLALAAGFDVHCTKPVDLKALAKLLRTAPPVSRDAHVAPG